MAENREKDEATGTATTGHEWDGIRELDTPLPRWWLWTFYATCVWALIYTILYPAWPLVSSATGGVLGWSSRGALTEAVQEHEAAQSVYVDQIAAKDLPAIAKDPELMRFAQAGGAAVFRTYCSQCHGSGAQGAKGYPNLNDDAWLWGGTLEDIHTTLLHGIRYEADPDTRFSQMPAFGDDGILTSAEIAKVATHVLSLSGQAEDDPEGATIFADNCAACHGEDGKGDQTLGAPNLTDAIWLYGGDRDTVIATITHSRRGVMPAWSGRLSDAQIKEVTLYVHSLGGGQ